jgi:Ca2+-binding RTX toxin-like protein
VGAFLIGCAVLVLAGCAGVRSEAPQEEEQERSSEATASEEARCEGTRTLKQEGEVFTTNDVPGWPSGGLLTGTDGGDVLDGKDGDDEIHGLSDFDWIFGGLGSDVIYGGDDNDMLDGGSYLGDPDESSKDVLHGGPGKDWLEDYDGGDDVLHGGDGDDKWLAGGAGEDVIYGGDGNDDIDGATVDPDGVQVRKQRDELYCGEGKDYYIADNSDYVDSSCEVKQAPANL